MAFTNTSSFHETKYLQFQHELIPGLPDELGMECLLRVPLTSHPTLRLVSHLWKSTISHPSFFTLRRRTQLAQNLIFLIQPQSPPQQPPPPPPPEEQEEVKSACLEDDKRNNNNDHNNPLLYNLNIYNTQSKEWRCLNGPTIPTFSQCVVFPEIGKVVVLGGLDPTTLEPVSRVLVLDLALGTWKEGSPMPKARSFFASAAVGTATVYVAGGHDGQKNALKSAAAYDVVADQWRELPSMAEERDESYGLVLKEDGKFWVVSGYGTESQGRFRPDAEVFDPDKWVWETVTGLWHNPGRSPKSTAVVTVVGEKRWWHVVEGEIREYEWEEKVWKGVNLGDSNLKRVNGSSVCMIDIGNGKIILMGNGGGEGMLVMEREKEDKMKIEEVEAPSRFMGFPFSATHILM